MNLTPKEEKRRREALLRAQGMSQAEIEQGLSEAKPEVRAGTAGPETHPLR
jgi:hypothetical protein